MTPENKLDFPQELLLLTKSFIPSWDLRSHVCFYLSSPRVAALYDSEEDPDAFWRLLCWENAIGAGLLQYENMDNDLWAYMSGSIEGLSWKDIAVDCISRDGFCTHPQCGETLLEYNRQRMREAAQYTEPFHPLRVSDNNYEATLDIHQLLGHIDFKRDRNIFERRPAVEHDAHLRPPGAPVRRTDDPEYMHRRDEYPGLYLAEHPLATRSFATLTPVSNIMLLHLGGVDLREGVMERGRAITVFDIVAAIHQEIDRYLTVDDACEYVSMHERCFPKEWTYRDAFSMTRTLRSILSVCPINTLEHQETNEYGPAFSFDQH
ncbi:hypothetical protein OH77DRAFT_1518906 [Trametes cingulata]|nr:hypothetical protein OH77DRAFT_1518906 [Trametes cingulata]